MKRRVVFINFLILVGIIIFAVRFISAWEGFEREYNLVQIVNEVQSEERSAQDLDMEPIPQPQPFSDFIVVSERNLFAEDRRPPSVEEESPPPEIPEEKPPKWADRPILHGVSSAGGKRQAIMTVFGDNQKKSQLRTIEVGDPVQGYTVSEIGNTLVKLKWKDREEIVDMADAQGTQRAKAAKSTASVTVIKVGAAPKAVQRTAARAADQQGGPVVEVAVVAAPSAQAGASQAGGVQRRGNQAAPLTPRQTQRPRR